MDLEDAIPEAAAAVANVAAAADVANAVAAAAAAANNIDNGLDINPNAVQGHAAPHIFLFNFACNYIILQPLLFCFNHCIKFI